MRSLWALGVYLRDELQKLYCLQQIPLLDFPVLAIKPILVSYCMIARMLPPQRYFFYAVKCPDLTRYPTYQIFCPFLVSFGATRAKNARKIARCSSNCTKLVPGAGIKARPELIWATRPTTTLCGSVVFARFCNIKGCLFLCGDSGPNRTINRKSGRFPFVSEGFSTVFLSALAATPAYSKGHLGFFFIVCLSDSLGSSFTLFRWVVVYHLPGMSRPLGLWQCAIQNCIYYMLNLLRFYIPRSLCSHCIVYCFCNSLPHCVYPHGLCLGFCAFLNAFFTPISFCLLESCSPCWLLVVGTVLVVSLRGSCAGCIACF